MHSRSNLDRPSDTPRASAAEIENDERHPLGFADVRTSGQALGTGQRRGLGFVTEPVQRFVTEMSFRRTPPPAIASGAEVTAPNRVVETPGYGASSPPEYGSSVGHATGISIEGTSAEMTGDRPSNDESVPFYKREISLRRRKPQEPLNVESNDLDEDAPTEADAPEAVPSHPVGFEWPSKDDPSDVETTPDVPSELEAAPAEVTTDSDPLAIEWSTDDLEPEDEITTPGPVVEHSSAEIDPVAADDASEQSSSEPPAQEPVADEPVVQAGVDEPIDDVREAVELNSTDQADAEDFAAFDATFSTDEAPVVDSEPGLSPALAPVVSVDTPIEGESAEGAAAGDKKKSRGLVRSGRGSKTGTKRTGSNNARGGRKVVGLKVGASQIAAAVVTQAEGRHQLVGLARTPLEPGIVVDGEVRDADALRDALKSFFDEHKLPRKDVRIGVASNRIGVRTFDIAGIDDQERFDNAVRFKAHEVLPVSVHESVLDYRVVDERVAEGGEVVRRVLLVVAPRDQIEPFVGACSEAGIRLGGIDLEALALLRAFVEPQPFALRTSTDTATVVVAIGHESTSLLVSGGGACEFTRVFDWGGSSLQHAIAQELEITEPEAGAVLQALSLSGSTSSLPQEQAARALDAIRARLTPFARELVSSLQFYQAQTESLGIGEIVITGGTSHLEGLADALHQMIGVSVRVGDPLQRVMPLVPITADLSAAIGSLAIPIGLAIEDEALRSVNLLPPELRNLGPKKPRLLSVALPVAAVIPFIAVGVMFMNASADVSDRQGQLETVQAQIDALPDPIKPDIDPTLEIAQQQRAAALATVLGGRLAWDRVLSDLSRVLPANVWLTHFSATAPTVSPLAQPAAVAPVPGTPVAAAPTGVVFEGYTYSLPDVARLLARLNALPSLTDVVLGTSAKTTIGKREAVSFTINANIASTGGAQ